MRYNTRYLARRRAIEGNSAKVEDNSDGGNQMRMTCIRKRKTQLGQTIEKRKAAGLSPPVSEMTPNVNQEHVVLKKEHLHSRNKALTRSQEEVADIQTESVDRDCVANRATTADGINDLCDASVRNNLRGDVPSFSARKALKVCCHIGKRSKTSNVKRRVRFFESHNLINNNAFDRTLSEYRRHLANDDAPGTTNIGSSSNPSPNYLSSIPRVGPSPSATSLAISMGSFYSPSLLSSLLSWGKTPFLPHIAAYIHLPHPLSSHIPFSPKFVHHSGTVLQNVTLAPLQTNFSSILQVCGRDEVAIQRTEGNLNEFGSYNVLENALCEAQPVIPNVLRGHNFDNGDKRGCKEGNCDVVENNSNDDSVGEANKGFSRQVGKESLCSQRELIDLIREQIRIEKAHLSRAKEESVVARELVSKMEERNEVDLRYLEIEERDRKRRRELERKRLKMEERDHMRMHSSEEYYANKRDALERERLELKRNELTLLAKERCARQEIDRRRMGLANDLRWRASLEERKEIETIQKMFSTMQKARVQRSTTRTFDILKHLTTLMNT